MRVAGQDIGRTLPVPACETMVVPLSAQNTGEEMPVALHGEAGERLFGRKPDGGMAGFGGWTKKAQRSGEPDVTELFGPEIVFRHVGETTEGAQPAGGRDAPAGLFADLAMQRAQDRLARVDPAARQLELGFRLGLVGHQNRSAAQQNRIDTTTQAIAPPVLTWLTESADHPGFRACLPAVQRIAPLAGPRSIIYADATDNPAAAAHPKRRPSGRGRGPKQGIG